MSAPSFANYVVKRPWLHRWVMPIAEWYTNAAGYRRLGLKYASPCLVPPIDNRIVLATERERKRGGFD